VPLTLSLLTEEYTIRVFENRVLRNAFRPKGEGLREGWKILHVSGMYILYEYCGIKLKIIKWER
jgi:hypothetical protein